MFMGNQSGVGYRITTFQPKGIETETLLFEVIATNPKKGNWVGAVTIWVILNMT